MRQILKTEGFNDIKEKCIKSGKSLSSEEWDQVKEINYPDFQGLHKIILKMEAFVAKSIADYHLKSNKFNSEPIPQLEYDLEWFLTWRVKLARFPHIVWCDGVKITDYEKINDQTHRIKAQIWIGPESNVNILFECEMDGIIELNSPPEKLKNYQFQIHYQEQPYFICKEI